MDRKTLIKKIVISFESKDFYTWKGKKFWIGAVNLLDGNIEEAYPYNKAKDHDFHHSMYFSPNALEKINEEEWAIFWFNKPGKLESLWRSGKGLPTDITCKIKKQIKPIKKAILKKVLAKLKKI